MTDEAKIMLGGVEYAIPPLAIKQNRRIEPLASKHLKYFADLSAVDGRVNLLTLTDEQADDFTSIVYYALTKTHPEITREKFEEMPISMREIMLALPVCLSQSGLFKMASGEGGNQNPGEAQSPSTGAQSQPNSATS